MYYLIDLLQYDTFDIFMLLYHVYEVKLKDLQWQ